MKVTIAPIGRSSNVAPRFGNELPTLFQLPPDKSILHRLLIIGSLTHSQITIPLTSLASVGIDVLSTVLALESLGVPIDLHEDHIELQGVGLRGYRVPSHKINCANSGTTARLLMGLLAGQTFASELIGDTSLMARPMSRLSSLLNAEFGAEIFTNAGGTLPAKIVGRKLKAAELKLPVASAQMKSAALLSGLLSDGITKVSEPSQSRDHTEQMLASFGYDIWEEDEKICLRGRSTFNLPDEFVYEVPGDISSAAFLLVAAIVLRKPMQLDELLLNATRSRFLEILTLMGIEIEIRNIREEWGETRGTILLHAERISSLLPFEIASEDVPLLIDELPVLAVLATQAEGESVIRGAKELRIKESDRIHLLHTQLTAFGVVSKEHEDGLSITGQPGIPLSHASITHGGDHRLAMAFAIASLFAESPCVIEEAEVVRISYPTFFEDLRTFVGQDHVLIEKENIHGENAWKD